MNQNDTETAAPDVELRTVRANGIELNVATAGQGPAVLLLHGWPQTWQVWRDVMPVLAATHRVIAPDLRGTGGSTRTTDGYDADSQALDAAGLLDALGEDTASVVALDAGVPVAFMLAMRKPERVRRLVLMEAVLPGLPGAEAFVAAGPPWWFGFHAVPGLAETVLVGHEAQYLDFFLNSGTGGRGVAPAVRDAFVQAYTGTQALAGGFGHYRAGPQNAAQIAAAVAAGRLTVPTLAIGAASVGEALAGQLARVADDLRASVMPDCGHIIPLDRPEALLALIQPFLSVTA